MSRNWKRVEFSGNSTGEMLLHVAPPLVVRRTVALVPASHTVLSETGARPRNCALVLVGLRSHVSEGLLEVRQLGWPAASDEKRAAQSTSSVKNRIISNLCDLLVTLEDCVVR